MKLMMPVHFKSCLVMALMVSGYQFFGLVIAPVYAAQVQGYIVESDLYVDINNQRIGPGSRWDASVEKNLGYQISKNYVGEVSFAGERYRYFQHNYPGLEVYTSNFMWDKQHRSIDSYIVSQLTIDSPKIKTYRGISVGMTEGYLIQKYGKGTPDFSDNQYWLYYDGDEKRVSFQIENGRVSHIMMVFNPDN
ncbi:hypothetical protein [Pluralibacter gergoviae]|uniref:Uncharacterized protein n=1 Tax=Pluralibacter gergoviae TaxID=61647 RepID=A0AAW8HU80_PLUGE|nr:hypothetical protein [Pluralibacter gergoviae]AVR02350.1 hypothetical protein A8H26_06330 [Pluralibacter gergoviae]EKV0933098.1 hypothetical protein [Pluralibacter gergoviae]EKV6250014.1 hypothetical protein [Pluralibacter gergoviae]EKW9969504.1 hypothetical protein [Pluralibacter gergoviae]ELD4274414.1 hypothetical protein [Pluralibacter gergoviae]